MLLAWWVIIPRGTLFISFTSSICTVYLGSAKNISMVEYGSSELSGSFSATQTSAGMPLIVLLPANTNLWGFTSRSSYANFKRTVRPSIIPCKTLGCPIKLYATRNFFRNSMNIWRNFKVKLFMKIFEIGQNRILHGPNFAASSYDGDIG